MLWQPLRPNDLPPTAAAIQVATLGGSARYLERGLFELIRLDPREYLSVIIRLAEHVDEIASSGAPPPGPSLELEDVSPLFPAPASSDDSARRLHITVAAHDDRSAPPGRDRNYYGEQPEDWNPYHPESTVSLLSRAEIVARGLGYAPVVSAMNCSSPDSHAPTHAGGEAEISPDGPGIVLIDPWMADDPRNVREVAEFDRRRKPWVRVLVPWSRSDAQTRERASVLRAKLQLTMPQSMESWRRTARFATRDLSTLADFGHALPAVVELAWNNYVKAARPAPIQGNLPPRPRLADAPETDPKVASPHDG